MTPGGEQPEDEEMECGHERARKDDVECPDCYADLALLDDEEGETA